MEGRMIKPVSSLIATLPSAQKMHRTIDEYYDEAHSGSNVESVGDAARMVGRRLAYFMVFVALGLANVGDAAEIGSMGFLLANDGFRDDILHGKDGIVASALYIGMLVGGVLAGPLCDSVGRRNVLLYGLIMNSSFGIASAMVGETWQLIICRCMMGLGIGGVVSCLLALTSEHTPPRLRGSYLNFVSAFWTIGSIYVALLAFLLFGVFDKNWRLFALINAAPSLISFVLVTCFVPESARFLALRGKHQRATQVANRISSSMGYHGEPLREDEIISHYSKVPSKKGAMQSLRSIYGDSTRGQILTMKLLWFFMSFGSGSCLWIARVFYELPFVNHIYMMTLFFSLASVPGVFVAGAVMDKMRRPMLLTTALVGTMLSMAGFTVVSTLTREAWAVVLAACTFHSTLVVAWSALSVVTAETFPTSIRGSAMGLCAGSGRLASVMVHLVSAPLIEKTGPTGLLIMGATAFAISAIVSIFSHLQSRTGAPLQDTVQEVTKPSASRRRTSSLEDLEMQTIHIRSQRSASSTG